MEYDIYLKNGYSVDEQLSYITSIKDSNQVEQLEYENSKLKDALSEILYKVRKSHPDLSIKFSHLI